MSKKVILESTVNQGALDRLMPFLEANLPAVRGFPGCLSVKVLMDQATGTLMFAEEWLSVEHHQSYIKAIAENGVMDELVSYLKSPPNIKYLDCVEI
ncbi:MAG: antibiotic biosynthesis monooxygenase [Chromatiales bacterium]|nr:antibiotic biosynthesis monooxygenase [Chromatiales bacterium]